MSVLERTSEDFSEEERSRLLVQFKESKLDYQEFAKEHNIKANTLRNWIWIEKYPGREIKRYCPVERKKIVESYLSSGIAADSFAKAWGIGPSTLSKWVSRYEKYGADGLMNKTPGKDDKRLGMKVPESVQQEIIALKKKEPSFGIKKMRNWIYRFRGVKVSTGSIRKTVKNEGLALARRPKKKKRSSEKVRRFERAKAMQLWQSDITQFTLGPSSMRVYLTVFMDDHSRYIVGWRLQSRQTADLVLDAFKDAVVRFGKPEEVLTDQGRQYFAWRGKSELEKLLEKEGIKHVVSRAHHPQTLGKCERFWETVGNEFWTRVKPQDLEEAKVRIKYFIDHYNHQRPHQGIDGAVPADRFFGVAEEVREVIERTVAANSLKLSLGELPQAPAFLIGQVGDQRIAFHGSSGRFYLAQEDLRGEQNGELASRSISVSEYAINRGERKEITQAAQNHNEAENAISTDTGAGSLGPGERGRTWTSAEDSCDDDGVMGGNEEQSGGGQEFRNEAGTFLADEQSSDGGNDGGMSDATTASQE